METSTEVPFCTGCDKQRLTQSSQFENSETRSQEDSDPLNKTDCSSVNGEIMRERAHSNLENGATFATSTDLHFPYTGSDQELDAISVSARTGCPQSAPIPIPRPSAPTPDSSPNQRAFVPLPVLLMPPVAAVPSNGIRPHLVHASISGKCYMFNKHPWCLMKIVVMIGSFN